MIVDASSVAAIVRRELEAPIFQRAIADAPSARISAANWFEAAIVIDRAGDSVASRRFDEFCRAAGLVVEPVTEEQMRIAREAYRDFGRGSGHPARLNFGDCFAYARAKATASRCCSRATTSGEPT